MQYGFYINTRRCTGCKTCQISCKDEKDLMIGQKYRRVYECGGGEWQQQNGTWQQTTFAYYLSISCNHCSNPTCVTGCPTGAMHKREQDGLVVINQETCIGCRYCEMRCPYGAPQFDNQKQIMSKCDGCYQRVSEGLAPVCVDSCPQHALAFGDITQLRTQYGQLDHIAPLPDASITQPNLVIDTHNASLEAQILNPEEV